MKKLLNIFLSGLVVIAVSSCKEDSPLNEVLDGNTAGASLRSLQESNDLDLSSLTSQYTHIFEIQDEQFGDLVQEVRVNVGFSDDDATSDDPANNVAAALFTTLPRSAFATPSQSEFNTHELPEGTFSTTLGDVLSFMGLDLNSDVDRGDVVNFNFEVVTVDGRVFNATNVGPNVGSSGRFAFFNSPFNYNAAIDDENRVVLSSIDINAESGAIRTGAADTVFLDFDLELITNPTITATDFQGNDIADDVVGSIQQLEGSSYFFLYTAGAAAADTVSFSVTGAEAVDNFAMEDATLDEAYIIDNVIPAASVSGSNLQITGANVGSVSVDFAFSELLFGEVTYTITSTQFDTITITQDEGDEAETSSITFIPMSGDNAIAQGNLSFTVTVTGTAGEGGIDIAGNAINNAVTLNL